LSFLGNQWFAQAMLVQYTTFVASLNSLFPRFFALSLAIHVLALVLWPKPSMRAMPQESIPVSLLPSSDNDRVTPTPTAPEATTRPSKTRARIARKNSPSVREKTLMGRPAPMSEPKPEPSPPPTREQIPEHAIIAERPLPTWKELLPSPGSLAEQKERRGGPISLESKDPQYISYFTSIKRSIDSNWTYPELAKQYGLQGKLLVEFQISENGELEGLRLIRSSGSELLDTEALRAIKAAAPFPPIPRWIEQRPLPLTATMIYNDARVPGGTRR
jgi:protein TonB